MTNIRRTSDPPVHGRALQSPLRARAASRLGRLLVLTGARQVGKTTLARRAFPDMAYISVEDPLIRPTLTAMSSAEWLDRYPQAIVDEVQKAPSLIETLKAAHDAAPECRYVLLGSSQILLLSKVRESLAGRAAIEELWPLTLPEMASESWDDVVPDSRLVTWLQHPKHDERLLLGIPAASPSFPGHRLRFERYLRFGGMPVVVDPALTDEECRLWLDDYRRTYLERDVADLAVLRDLEPFVVSQAAIAARTGCLINYSDLARVASVTPATAQRFLRYLELSYQTFLLPPFFRNIGKRLSKQPKVHVLDPGILRSTLNHSGNPTGAEFESGVVAEIYKQVKTARLRAEFCHLRTHDGREVDLLVGLEGGWVAVEVKMSDRVAETDARHLVGLGELLDRPLLASLLLTRDPHARRLANGVLALPAAWALSPRD